MSRLPNIHLSHTSHWLTPEGAPDEARALDLEVEQRMTSRYFEVIQQVGTGSLVGTITLLGGFYFRHPDPLFLLWLAIIVAVGIAWTVAGRWPPLRPGRSRQVVLERRVFLLASASGFSYGAVAYVGFVPGDTAGNAALVLACVMALAAMAAGNYWLKRATVVWCALFGGMLALRVALQAGSAYQLLAASLAVYTLLQILFAMQAHRMQAQSIRQVILNERMAAHLDTQVRRAEAAGVQAQRASEEKSRFLAAASHDLRQPLHAICLLTDSMRGRLAGRDEAEHFERLASSVTELSESLELILDMSRMDAGNVPREMGPVSVAELVAVIQRRYGERAATKGLSMRFFHRDQIIRADKAMMERLLGNLVDNAIKFTNNGSVLVAARTRRSRSGSPVVALEVRDSGSGIDASAHESVFDEFYQVANVARDRGEGLGLGLSIVRRLAKVMEMQVELRSAPGCGSTFTVVCAVAAKAPEARPVQEAPTPDVTCLRGIRLLLVDNEQAILHAAKEALVAYGISVTTAATADEAINAAAATRFDVAVLDFRLSEDIDGRQLAARLRELHTGDMPIVIVTGDTAPALVRELHQAGLLVELKPLDNRRLAAVLVGCIGAQARPANASLPCRGDAPAGTGQPLLNRI